MDKNFESYNNKKQKALTLLTECCNKVTNNKTVNLLREKKEKLEQDRFVVSVFGHFSNGKSTFLNSLMGFGHEVLKEDDLPSTATITRLRYADEKDERYDRAEVIFRDRTSKWINREDLNSFVARNNDVDVERTISEVILYLKSSFLENGVEIVDTPGFNSTYQIHTEIALQQVEKSDAAIFLFSCEKPGNSEELEFLKKVSRYMSRVFFVLNKFDCSSDNGKTEKESIYSKMKKMNIDTEGKRMFPLSSKRAKEAIADGDKEKLIASGLPEFEEVLSTYLTGEENVKDRLLAPLNSVLAILEQEKDFVSEQITACSKSRNELNTEIQKRKNDIREREKELSNRKRNISSSVKLESQATKREVRSIVAKVGNAQSDRLSKINSKFDIRLNRFDDMNMEAYLMFAHEWENSASHLEGQLLNILDTSVDSEDDYEKISETIAAAIRSHLQLEQINVDEPDFDFSDLSKIDEEIKKAKEEYDKAYNRVSNLYAAKSDRDEALENIEKLEKELERLRNRKEKRIDMLSTVQVEYSSELEVYDAYVKRSKIGQFFLGDKRVERTRRKEYVDDRAKRAAEEEIKKIEKELNENRLATKEKVDIIKRRIEASEFKQIDREIARAEIEEQASLEELMKKREAEWEEKHAMEREIICVEKDKYLRELKKTLEEMGKNIIAFIDKSQSNFISILNTALDMESTLIEKEKNNIEKMVSINDKSPEDIDQELVLLTKESDELRKCLDSVRKTEGEIENAD